MGTKVKAIVFDMDGVLIDAKEWHFEALNRALGHFGYKVDRYDHLVTYDGLPTRRKLEILTRDHGLPAALHGFLNELKQIYTMEIIHQHCKPTFQHEFALSRLKAHGFKLAVASNSIRRTVEVMMEKANLSVYLDKMVSNQDVKKAKPDPEIYVKTFELLGVLPGEAVVVEDNENGILAGEASGANVLVVADVHEVTLDRVLGFIRDVEGRR